MNKIEIQYHKNSCVYGEFLKDKNWFIFLDSCNDISSFGKYDIITCDPYLTITSKGNHINLIQDDIESSFYDNPFDVIRKYFKRNSNFTDLPFTSGMIGYFGYDSLSGFNDNNSEFPDIAVGFYDWSIVVNHDKRISHIVFENENSLIKKIIEAFTGNVSDYLILDEECFFFNFSQSISKDKYIKDVVRIKNYIANGDCYQVNYSQEFCADYKGDPWDIYKNIRRLNPAPYSSFIRFDEKYVISSSPERFISIVKNHVETKPIKGTLKRMEDPNLDKEQIRILKNDEKNISENLMIVDLLRNDLSKCCELGSVKVTKLFDIESYASVHHMVSTIEGDLNKSDSSINILEACFPGGSITGAPKIRSMEIISELEKRRRGVYCGSIGYFDKNNNMDTNICIRTIMLHENKLVFSAGGGIVHDSDPEDEYYESLEKVAIFIKYFSNGNYKW